MLDALVGLVMFLVEVALYLLITSWVLGLIFRSIKGSAGSGGGHGGMGIGGHLVVAAVVGGVRLAGRAFVLVGGAFFTGVVSAARGLGRLTPRLAAVEADPPASRTERRWRLPRRATSWPRPRRRRSAEVVRRPSDEFEDEWRRAFGGDD